MNHASVTILGGDCLEQLASLADNSVDSIITDPPYGLSNTTPDKVAQTLALWVSGDDRAVPSGRGFMGNEWDAFVPPPAVWKECLRVLKPGGHMAVFAGSRTQDLMGLSIRLAGFEIRDGLVWLYGSGFNKAGPLGNRKNVDWCECGGDSVPYSHADNSDVSRMRDDVHPLPLSCEEGQDPLLLSGVQREGSGQGVGQARAQGQGSVVGGDGSEVSEEDDGGGEPRMEGRDLHRARQGVSNGSQSDSPSGEGERVRGRAPHSDGGDDRSTSGAAGGGSPHQRDQDGQPTGEPEALRGPSGSLGGGASGVHPSCSTCGGLNPVFKGFSPALKPAQEPIILARKPFSGTLDRNVLAHGTGALNVDASRVGSETRVNQPAGNKPGGAALNMSATGMPSDAEAQSTKGRYPANVLLDPEAAAALDEQTGVLTSGKASADGHKRSQPPGEGIYGGGKGLWSDAGDAGQLYGDKGGASRFFPVFKYQSKAPKRERPVVTRADGTKVQHPTVKPLALMDWLITLITPPGGKVLDPFAGSGTTLQAARDAGFPSVGIEAHAPYVSLIMDRLEQDS